MPATLTRRRFHSLIALPLLIPTLRAEASPLPSAQSDLAHAALRQIATHYPGLSATVFVKGRKVWSGHRGYADTASKRAVTDDTRFNIYSTSKALTGLAFARLVQAGQLSLTTTAGALAPDLPSHLHPIRIGDILSHTSGIRHYSSAQDWLRFANLSCTTPAQALSYFQDDPLVHPPGSAEHYSSFAFVLASHLLMRATRQDDFAQALNLTLGDWAQFELDHPGANKATPYMEAGLLPALPPGKATKDVIPAPLPPASCKFGGGGLIASASQLAEAGAALTSGQIIPKDRIAETLRPWSEASGVAYGGGIGQMTHAGKTVTTYSLSGGAPGGRSYLLALIEPEISVAICGNIDGPNLASTAETLALAF